MDEPDKLEAWTKSLAGGGDRQKMSALGKLFIWGGIGAIAVGVLFVAEGGAEARLGWALEMGGVAVLFTGAYLFRGGASE